MIKLAEFQASQKLFAGVFIPYKMPKKADKGSVKKKGKSVSVDVKSAILGGGDIIFPIITFGLFAQFTSINKQR